MKNLGCCSKFLETSKPYFAMIALQFGYAGMNIITKVSLNRGMSHYVLVVYRHAIATAVIAPFALFFERKMQPKITFPVFMQIFVLALLGPVIDQNFYYAGLKYTSPTFSCAMSNMLPAMTFRHGSHIPDGETEHKDGEMPGEAGGNFSDRTTDKDWFKGSILLIIATLAWASLFVLQTKALKTYKNHQLSLTSLVCFVGTLQAVAVTFVMEHETSVWRIGWDMNLLAAAYAGIVTSSISYYVQGLVIKIKGPVFATAFSPLMMIVVAIMGSFILAEKIYLGGILGAVLIVIGLYSVLWGKHKEKMEVDPEEIPEPVKGVPANGNPIMVIGDIEANEVEFQKAEAKNKFSAMAMSMPMALPELPRGESREPRQ
ncbi:WAT1-RELATED PROTEIN [Salix purpurea]|uniref:WAT1-related protein n=1 Tax=Salix purpurea TaxID=77065 RepID=A0A9Q0QE18_SALPP|nr:WAT1-RELATED PROTEIN [Salix purpurea]